MKVTYIAPVAVSPAPKAVSEVPLVRPFSQA